MRVILFGASGMVGQGILRECLLDQEVSEVLALGREALPENAMLRALGENARGKLRVRVLKNLADMSGAETEMTGFDACFFSLGVSAPGMSAEAYRRITFDLTVSVARTLARLNPAMTFVYVSGAGTDREARAMWARVKGETEDALLALPFRAAYMFRPGLIQPLHGIRSKTRAYQWTYNVLGPILTPLRRLLPRRVTTTEQLGQAFLHVVREGYPQRILEAADLCGLGPAAALPVH